MTGAAGRACDDARDVPPFQPLDLAEVIRAVLDGESGLSDYLRGALVARRGPQAKRPTRGWVDQTAQHVLSTVQSSRATWQVNHVRAEAERQARGALAIESVEPEFDFSHEGHVTGLVPTEQTESHRVIEHLMIAANEAVATLLETRKLAGLFRIHEQPEPARVERLVDQLASLEVPTPPVPPALSPPSTIRPASRPSARQSSQAR